MGAILSGGATPAQLIAFSVALRIKGETADELSGLLDAVLAAATLVPLGDELRSRAIDIVGTGGDRSHSINVSTMAAIVTAAAGVPVCKHGARGASSQCGTADVLEALGVAIELPPEGVLRCVEEAGIGFCFAPRFHPAFRFAAPARREVGVPLDVQPARADGQSGSGAPPGHRCRRCPLRRADAGVAAGPRFDRRLDRPRRWARRADDDRPVDRARPRARRQRARRSRSIRSPSASPRRRTSSSSAAIRRTTPTSCAACSTANEGRIATSSCSTQPPPSSWPPPPSRWPMASSWRRRRSTAARPQPRSTSGSPRPKQRRS